MQSALFFFPQTRYCLCVKASYAKRCTNSLTFGLTYSQTLIFKCLRGVICEAQILQELIFSWYFSSWMVDVLWKEQIPGCYGSLKVLKKWVKKGKHKCKSQTVCLYLGLPLGYFWLCCLFKSLLKSCSICPSEYMLTCTLHCCRGANSALEALVVFNLFAV